MDYLVEGTDVLSKEQLQKVTAGQECQFAGCDVHCGLKIIGVCIIICRMDDSVIERRT
jgi:hypothetical protein